MIARKVPLRRSRVKAKPTKRSTLRNKADRLFSQLIRAPGFCARCGAADGLQCSHFISRRYANVRWNPLNAECLCLRCHKFLTERPIEAHDRAVELLGPLPYDELRRLALATLPPPDYRMIVDELSARLRSLLASGEPK